MTLTSVLPALITALIMLAVTGRLIVWLRQRQIMDRPNERSSHTIPTPRGGGLAVTTAVAAGWLVALPFLTLAVPVAVFTVAALVLMLVSWMDDRRSLPPGPRFLVQVVAVVAGLAAIPAESLVFQGWLPLWADRLLAALGWLWFVNLYNFMDGIDGITGVQTASLGGGLALIGALGGPAPLVPLGLSCLAGGALFLRWNWHPAKVFLGDVGSVPLGYLLGGLLVLLAGSGHLAATLILPAYYLADATITLGRRAARGEKVWLPHRSHFYQRAVQGGHSHAQVSTTILAANMILVMIGVSALWLSPWIAAALAAVTTAGLLLVLQFWSKGKQA